MGFNRKPCSPEHAKTMNAARPEKKDPKVPIERRLTRYRNTPHPSIGKMLSELMFNRMVRTRLPTVRVPVSTQAVQEAREKDQQEKLKRNEMRDKRKTAQEKMVKVGDMVLVAQRKTTTKPTFEVKKRNLAKVKILRERLQIKPRKEKESTEC